jgi:general secretion pathway protein K
VSRTRERGVALVAATIALALVSALATTLAYTTTVDQRLARNALAALQADALARSGIAAAAVVLRETGATDEPDTLRAPWTRPSGRQPLGAGWVEVTIEDEARRLDLNAPGDELARLMALLHLDPRLATALADWTDADDVPRPDGAERDWYQRLTPPRLPRNGALRSLEELGLVRGFDAPVLARLHPFVTAAGEPGVNPNTAAPEVLLAVAHDPAAVARVLTLRAGRPLRRADFDALLPGVASERLVERGEAYRVRAVAGVGEMRRAVEATLWAPPQTGRAPEIVAWQQVPAPD